MKKRGNELGQLRAEEVEALNDEESEDAGVFKRAPDSVLQQRRIVRTNRTPVQSSASPSTQAAGAPAASASNPFGGFSFAGNGAAASAPAPTAANPFGGFTGLTGLTSAPAPAPALSFKPAPIPAPAPAPSQSFNISSAPTAITGKQASSSSSSLGVVGVSSQQGAKNGNDGPSDEFTKKVTKLNASFKSWVNRQGVENPFSIWKEGLRDYIKHFDSISNKYGASTGEGAVQKQQPSFSSAPAPSMPSATPAPKAFDIKAAPLTLATPAFSAPTVPKDTTESKPAAVSTTTGNGFSGFNFPSTGAAAPAPAPTSGFGVGNMFTPAPTKDSDKGSKSTGAMSISATPAAPSVEKTAAPAPAAAVGFSFGKGAAAPAPAPFSGFSFGATPAPAPAPAAAPAFGGFGAPSGGSGAASTSTFGGFGAPAGGGGFGTSAGAGGGNDDEDGEEDGEPMMEPEKILRNEDDKDVVKHEVPCKLFRLNTETKEWGDLGKGSLRVTMDPDTKKHRTLIRNTMGKILVNAYFYKTQKFDIVKNAIKFSAIVSDDDGKAQMKNFMVKLKESDVQKTKDQLEAAKATLA